MENMEKVDLKEAPRHSLSVPFSYYNSRIPEYFPCTPLHWHTDFEINYILQGCATFICGDEKFVSDVGDIIITPPNMLHAIYPLPDQTQYYNTLVFNPEMLGASSNDRCSFECIRPIISGKFQVNVRITKEHPDYMELQHIIENIMSCAKKNSSRNDMLMKSELLRLFWFLENTGDIAPVENDSASLNEVLRPAIEYINANFRENMTVEHLASLTNLSKSYFMSRFKKAIGIGAIEYLTQLRIKYACDALLSTDKSAAEIAFDCGFCNLSNFNRQFKKIVGCTPREYRRLNHYE